MKYGYKLMIALLLSFLSLSAFAASLCTHQESNKTSYLYIQHARLAKLVANKNTHNYQLILRKADAFVVYFSDRPIRKAGIMSTSEFVQLWKNRKLNGFNLDAPNVAINGVTLHRLHRHKDISVVLALSHPVYNAKTDNLTYTATVIGGDTSHLPKAVGLKNIVLFFDGYCPGCVG